MTRANLKTQKFCAFCKHWYDPTNSNIRPTNPRLSLWEFDSTAKCMCMKRNHEMKGGERCGYYDCKI